MQYFIMQICTTQHRINAKCKYLLCFLHNRYNNSEESFARRWEYCIYAMRIINKVINAEIG